MREYPPMSSSRSLNPGFSLVELLVVIGIIILLFSIFVPYVAKVRETDHRAKCADNLRMIMQGLQIYANSNHAMLPRVVYDPAHNPDGYTVYTGASAADPFARDSAVRPNDVTASLWLLVRADSLQPATFICPASAQTPEPGDANDWKHHSNFSGGVHLSYSYASPFSSAPGYTLNNYLPAEFALMADKNPGISALGSNVTAPPYTAEPFDIAQANSNNHGRAGQNVLYADGHVAFQTTPYCGVGHGAVRDNIFTALQRTPVQKGQNPPPEANGVVGRDVGPAWVGDSYLVPTDQD
jgi:prepilin-type processing-associated H-X9-DG protein